MTCCREHNCRRALPILIYWGHFSGRVYAATRMRKTGTEGTYEAAEKHDVTSQVMEFIRQNADWVRSVLDREGTQ